MTNIPQDDGANLPEPVRRRHITEAQWRTLFNLFPGAKPESVVMVWDYCVARKLDPLKKPCHIVPMRVKQGDQWLWKDVVMPGIYEYRITAQRTGLYLGHTEPVYGPETTVHGVTAPAWCAMTFYRLNHHTKKPVPFPVKVHFAEVVGTTTDRQTKKETVNDRWGRAPIQMLTKTTEAAGLREAFPEEFGGEPTAEEMDGQASGEPAAVTVAALPQPAQRRAVEPVIEATLTGLSRGTYPASQPEAVEAALEPDPEPAVDTVPEPAEPLPPHVGRIVDIVAKPGATYVTLDTGFVAGTRDIVVVTDATEAREMGAIVELETEAPSDPARFKPKLLRVKARLDLMNE